VEITMTTRGRLTLPIAVRRKLNLAAGSKLNFDDTDGKITLIPMCAPEDVFEKYRGTVGFGIKGGRRGIIKYVRDMRDGK
jgi:AbrB family looped-hinge helix DNA binding protein